MDISYTKTHLHPQTKAILFQHLAALNTIFRSVLGLFEMDYMSLTLVNHKSELLILSSKPSIEWNLIDQDLLQFDFAYHPDFLNQHEMQVWSDLYDSRYQHELYNFKQKTPQLNFGFAIPSIYNEMKVAYSFATKSNNKKDINKMTADPESLLRIGRFCLQKILKTIALPDVSHKAAHQPLLKLVINKESKQS